MHRTPLAGALLLAAAPLAAQVPPSLDRLAFMAGCWEAPTQLRAGTGTVEERWTLPTNLMLGTSRTNRAGRTVTFEFLLIRVDSAGIVLTPYPRGIRSAHDFRLTQLNDSLALFEAPEHDYPKRISYRRRADGALVARVDGGPADAGSEWPMRPVACGTAPDAPRRPPLE